MGDIVGKCNTFGICDFDLLTISCGTLPTGCGSFLEYCNSYEDLQAQYCGSNVCSTQDQESACENHYRTWGQSEGRDCPVEPTEPPRACCAAMTADCLACSENMSVEDYCKMYPETIGCQPVECPPLLCRMHCENGYVQENGCDICECISDEREIEVCPEGCITWYDGCNNCICNGGEATICTLKGCSVMEDPYCAEFEIEGPIVTEDPKEPCISVLCESGCDLVGADESGCGGECICPSTKQGSVHQCAAEYGTCACSGNVVYGYGDRWSEPLLIHGSTQCSNHVFGDPYYGQVKVCMCTPSVVTSMEVRFTTSDSGDNCDNACEAIGEQCIEEMLFLQSAEEVASWALEVNVTCSQILDRCDIGESPIFLEDNGVCTFCSNPNHPGWDNGNRCGAQWDIRQRICPCTSTLAESTSTTTPEESTTELPEDYEFVQGGLCGEDWRDMMRGAIELSRNNGEPAKDPMECAKLTAENSECGSYFVQRNDYHVCWCMSKQGVHADCSIRDDWQIHSSGNSYGSIYKLVDPVVTSVYKKTDCRFDYSSTARSAGDYGAHLNTPKTLEECEALCDANPECASFVVDQMGGGKCHLRTECPLVNEDCIEASSWGFINYVKEDCEASSPTSLPDDLPSTMNWTAYVMEYGTNECALGTTEITNEDYCRAAQQQLGLDWNEVVNCNWCPGGCYTSSGWVNWNTHSGAARVHDAPICRSTVVTSMEVRFTTSDSGDNCDNACEAIGEECIEEMLFLQSAEEVASWALEVGVACSLNFG
eukprot:UN02427